MLPPLSEPGEEVFRVCDELVDDVVTVSDSQIAQVCFLLGFFSYARQLD